MKVNNKDTHTVSQAELQAAMRRFLSAGGMIHKLPDQKKSASQVVGMRWNTSELAGERG